MSVPASAATADRGGLYPARSQALVRMQLVEAIKRRDGVVTLIGESGTGKTTLCRSVLRALDPPAFVADIVNSFITIDELLKQALSDFGADVQQPAMNGASSHDLMLAVGGFLDSMPPSGRAILVIDEAHDVRPEVLAQLRTLANFERPDGRSLQIILIGQPALDSMLARMELLPIRQRLTRRCQLQPLADDEIEPYMAHRFRGNRRPSFLRSAIRSVLALSRGVPRTINLLADGAFEIGAERKLLAIDRAVVLESARRSAIHVPIGQRVLTRRLAVAAALAIASALSVWLVVLRVVPYVRTVIASSAVPTTPTASPIAAERVNAVVTTPTQPAPAHAAASPAAAPSVPAPDAAPPKVDSLQPADSFLVLAGSFRSARNAESSVDRLSKLQLPAFTRQEGDWNVVLIGPYVTPEEARQALDQIGRNFPDAHVIRVRVPDPQK